MTPTDVDDAVDVGTEASSPVVDVDRSLAIRAVLSLLVGLSGTVAAVRGWGPVIMYPGEQRQGLVVIVPAAILLVVVLAICVRRVPFVQVVASAVAIGASTALTAANVGRAPSLVGLSSVAVAYAVLAEWRPWPSHPARTERFALFAVPSLIAAQVVWVILDSLLAAAALLLLTMILVEVASVRAAAVGRTQRRAVGRLSSALAVSVSVASAGIRAAVRGACAVDAAVAGAARRGAAALARSRRRMTWPAPVARWGRDLGAERPLWRPFVGGLLAALASGPLFWRLVNDNPGARYLGINDYDIHVTSARHITFVPFRFDVPHFLFHVETAVWSRLLGERFGPVLTLMIATAMSFVAVVLLLRTPERQGGRLSQAAAEGATVVWAFLETPTVVLIYLGLVSPRTRFMTVQTLYSPTWVASLPFALLTLLSAGRLLRRVREDGARQREAAWAVAATLFVTTIAKPALAVCLLPGLLVYLLLCRVPIGRIVALMTRIAVPTTALVAWQTWFLASGKSAAWADHFKFDPIGGPVYGWSQARWAFWLPVAWVVLAIWATRGRFLRDPLVQLTLCCTVFAVAIFLLFVEAGERAGHGNLGVPLQLCGTFLLLLATRSLAVEAAEVWRTRRTANFPLWFGVGGLLAVAFVAAGILAYADTLGWVRIPISWYPLY